MDVWAWRWGWSVRANGWRRLVWPLFMCVFMCWGWYRSTRKRRLLDIAFPSTVIFCCAGISNFIFFFFYQSFLYTPHYLKYDLQFYCFLCISEFFYFIFFEKGKQWRKMNDLHLLRMLCCFIVIFLCFILQLLLYYLPWKVVGICRFISVNSCFHCVTLRRNIPTFFHLITWPFWYFVCKLLLECCCGDFYRAWFIQPPLVMDSFFFGGGGKKK